MRVFALLSALVVLAACSATGTGTSIAGVELGEELEFADLDRDDYILIDGVTGAARFSMTRWLLLFDVPREVEPPTYDETRIHYDDDDEGPVAMLALPIGTSLDEAKKEAMSRAVHEALMTVTEADGMLEPRYTWDWEYNQIWPFWWQGVATCRVWGKAVRLKDG